MKTFAIVMLTTLVILASILGFECALGSGFEWLEYHIRGYLGAALFPAVIAFAAATGNPYGLASKL